MTLPLGLLVATVAAGSFAAATTVAATPGATADLRTTTGAPAGHARFVPVAGGIELIVDATGLPPGAHGIHVHTTGLCEAPGFTTAGGHWNPTMRKHGSLAPDGKHEGDLPNLVVGADGTGHADVIIAGATLTGGSMALLDADGAALVIHAGPDDYQTDPSGNSGARIACGVITAG